MGRMTDFEPNNHVRIDDPLDTHYECEGIVKAFNVKTGDYMIEMVTGDAKGDTLKYSSTDLKLN